MELIRTTNLSSPHFFKTLVFLTLNPLLLQMNLRRLATSVLNSRLDSHPSLRNVLGNGVFFTLLFSTQTTSSSSSSTSHVDLFRRISRVGGPTESIIPVLNQWVNEGRYVGRKQLQTYIREMRYFKRFSHALQISMWMTDKRFFPLSRGDAAVRLDLISKVHGLEQAEKFFDGMSIELKGLEVYSALLNCYAKEKSVDKAEAIT